MSSATHFVRRKIAASRTPRNDGGMNRHHEAEGRGDLFSKVALWAVATTLVLMPVALSPVSSDPAMAGQTALLLVAVTVLCLVLAVKEVKEQRTEQQINGEKAPFLRSSVLRPPFSILLALVLTLIMIVTSSNRTLALTSPQAKVVLVLLFFLAVKKMKIASLLRKAWLGGVVIFGLLYLVFGTPLNLFKHLSGGGLNEWKATQVARALVAPQFNLVRPDWQTSLKVATETLSHSPLFGAGLGHYPSAFSSYRGTAFNASPLWNYKYTSSFSTLFNWVTEGGVVGIAIYLLIFFPAFSWLFNLGWRGVISKIKNQISKIQSKDQRRGPHFSICSLRCIFDFLFLRFDIIVVVGLALSSLFFPFSLAGYFYLITGYLFIYDN